MIIEKNTKFAPHPVTEGPIRAVVVDVTEPKEKDTKYGKKLKFALVFETDMKMDDGRNWTYWDHGYTPSINEKSTLRKTAVRILGTEKLPEPFDTENLIGKPVKLIIEHDDRDGEVYARISYLAADKSPDAMRPTGKYIRQKDKNRTDTGASYQKAEATPEEKLPWQQTKVHVGKFKGHQLEDLDGEAIKALITHWLPTVTGPDAKPTADDRRLINGLHEAQAVLNQLAEEVTAAPY